MKPVYINRLKDLTKYLDENTNEFKYAPPQLIIFYDEKRHVGYEDYYHHFVFAKWPEVHHGFYYAGSIPVFKLNRFGGTQDWITLGGNPAYRLADNQHFIDPFRARTVWSALFYYGLDIEDFKNLFGADTENEIISVEEISNKIKNYISSIEKSANEIFNNRLLKFADFIAGLPEPDEKETRKIKMSFIRGGEKEAVEVNVLFWVFRELPFCFNEDDEWYFDSFSEEPKIGPAESTSTIESVFEFFNLEEGFLEIFAVNNEVNEESVYYDIAQNIVNYVKKVRGI